MAQKGVEGEEEEPDWGAVFFALMHYCHLSKEEIWDLTLPQLELLLEQINKHMKYEIALAGGEVEEEQELTDVDLMFLKSMPGIG